MSESHAQPYPTATVLQGDCREVLKTLADASVHCCVTSPPYYSLRDYGTATWEGGDAECDHIEMAVGMSGKNTLGPNGHLPESNAANVGRRRQYKTDCAKCGAVRTDRQIGLERSPEDYVAELVAVFREVRRVLHPSGLLWLVIGDSYAANRSYQVPPTKWTGLDFGGSNATRVPDGLKSKDLIGIPWMAGFALRADGWWLRQDIIWHKTAPMPESVTDRCTKAHEYVFMLSKSERYFFDQTAIAESAVKGDAGAGASSWRPGQSGNERILAGQTDLQRATRNKRSVWTIGPEPLSAAHFAVYPQKLVEPMVLAGTSEKGCCPGCLAPWARVVERERTFESGSGRSGNMPSGKNGNAMQGGGATLDIRRGPVVHSRATGWEPSCTCPPHDPIPCTILDPFAGSGTTLRVAIKHGRNALGIELNPEYAAIIDKRLHTDVRLPLDFGEAVS